MITTCARSSPLSVSAPKGQPEPTIKSQVISSFLASAKVTCNMLIHSSLNQVRDFFPKSSPVDVNEIGLISTPPIPASFNKCNSLTSSLASTLSPFHHHRTKG